MRKSLLVGLLVALLVSGFAGAAAVAVRGDGRTQASPSSSSTHGDDAQTEQGKPERDKADRDKADRGHGPPPWAGRDNAGRDNAGRDNAGRDKAGRDDNGHGKPAGDDWRAAWKALTPAQREARMRALAKAHDEGMQRWLACVTDAGTDQAKRKACEKPLPPGLAKRQS